MRDVRPLGAMPGWTEGDDSDPGIALLQVLAFLGDSLLLVAAVVTAVASGRRLACTVTRCIGKSRLQPR